MKKLLLTLLLGGLAFGVMAQEPVSKSTQRFYYVEIYEVSTLGLHSVNVDFGLNAPTGMTYKIIDENEQNLDFKNMVAALNYLSRQGWEVVTVYDRDQGKAGTRTYYLLRFDAEAHPKTALVRSVDEALDKLQF